MSCAKVDAYIPLNGQCEGVDNVERKAVTQSGECYSKKGNYWKE